MPKLTIGRMAKLYDLHRSTLYEAVEKGRVSCSFDGKGHRIIDLSEMMRVYGEAPSQLSPARQHPTAIPDSSLLEELRRQTVVIERMAERIERLEQALLRLPAPRQPDGAKQAAGEALAPDLADDDPHGLRALARSLPG